MSKQIPFYVLFPIALTGILPAAVAKDPQVLLPVGHRARITGLVEISPRLVVTCSEDATLILWDVDTGFPLKRVFLPDQANFMSTDDSGRLLRVNCGIQRRGFWNLTVEALAGEIRSETATDTSPPPQTLPGDLPDFLRHEQAIRGKATVYVEGKGRAYAGYSDGTVEAYAVGDVKAQLLQQFRPEISRTTSVASHEGGVATWRYNPFTKGETDRHDLMFWRPGRLEAFSAEQGDSSSIFSGLFINEGEHFLTCENHAFETGWWLVVRETDEGRIVDRKASRSPFPTVLSLGSDGVTLLETFFSATGPGVARWRLEGGKLTFSKEYASIRGNRAVFDSRRQRIYSQSFVIEGENAVDAFQVSSGRLDETFRSPSTDVMFGTVVDCRYDPDLNRLLLSTYHRGIGYCGIVSLGNGSLQEIPWDGIHAALALGKGREELLLASTEGSVEVAVYSPSRRAVLDRWWDPQSESHRAHRVAAVGWEVEKDSVSYSPDASVAWVVKPTGAVQALAVSEVGELSPIGELIPLADGEWCILLPDGTYAASPNGAGRLAFTEGNVALPFDHYDLLFNRPATIAETFAGEPETINRLAKATEERLRKNGISEQGVDELRPVFSPKWKVVNRSQHSGLVRAETIALEIASRRGVPGTITIRRNGIELPESRNREAASAADLTVPLAPGTNTLEISESADRPWESPPTTLRVERAAGSAAPNLYLLGIGVSDYENDSLDLNFAAKDILDTFAFFRSQEGLHYQKIHTLALVDGDATREKIADAAEFFSAASTDDTAIVFVAGHGFLETGTLDYYFGTTDIDIHNVSERGATYDELTGLLENCPAGSRLMLMDTCFAGEVELFDIAGAEGAVAEGVTVRALALAEAPRRRAGSLFELRNQLFSNLGRTTGLNVVTASGGMEFVYAIEASGNGLFTHALLDGFSSGRSDGDGDGVILLSEAYRYLGEALTDLSGGAQKAFFREVNTHGDVVLAVCDPKPRFNQGQFLGDLIRFSEGRGLEAQYAAMFAPRATYFGSTKSPAEIEAAEIAYHEKYDGRSISLTKEPVVERVSDTSVRVEYQLRLFLINRKEARTFSPLFGAEEVIDQELILEAAFMSGQWQITSLAAKDSKRLPNPHFREGG
ncbi:MAG: hypothetical protein AAF236_08090 [Verrucomicrobiota bacterium]